MPYERSPDPQARRAGIDNVTMGASALLYRWKDRVKSEAGPEDPVLRPVCLVLVDWCPRERAQHPEIEVSVTRLASQVSLDERNVRVRLRQLEAAGWLTVEKRPGRRSIYQPALAEALRGRLPEPKED